MFPRTKAAADCIKILKCDNMYHVTFRKEHGDDYATLKNGRSATIGRVATAPSPNSQMSHVYRVNIPIATAESNTPSEDLPQIRGVTPGLGSRRYR
jgi:hypothetical protein